MPPANRSLAAKRGLLAALAAAVIAASASAAEPAGRAGGLVPGNAAGTAVTREELVRQWDLDGDGTISKPEADVARGRMRRRRLELQAEASIDPITGMPRRFVEPPAEPGAGGEGEPVFRLPPEPAVPVPASRREGSPFLPKVETPEAGIELAPRRPALGGSPGQSADASDPTRISGRASWLPPQPLAPATRGGVRAGAPAAASGYGAGRWGDLNAGRRPAAPRSEGERGEPASPSGGLVPAGRPSRSGALILPVVPGQSRGVTPRPAAATPIPRPRITADEIGGGP